jgi:hypothetical protein
MCRLSLLAFAVIGMRFKSYLLKWTEVIGRLNKHYNGDALQRTQVYYWVKEGKSERKNTSNTPPLRRAANEGLNDCIGKALKGDPRLSMGKIAKGLTISSATVQSHLTQSLGIKCDDIRWIPPQVGGGIKGQT